MVVRTDLVQKVYVQFKYARLRMVEDLRIYTFNTFHCSLSNYKRGL